MAATRAEGLQVTMSMSKSGAKADYTSLARALLPAIEAFFENPENEKAFRAWKERREGNDQRKKAAGA